MTPSAKCLDIGRQSEGLRLTAYRDTGGVWTIGRGHTGPDVKPGLTWTLAQAEAAFAADMEEAGAGVEKLAHGCSQDEFDALTDFAFNLGLGALAGSTLLRLHNAGHRADAAAEFGRWVHDDGQVLPGLIIRRAREALLYLSAAA